MTTWLDIIDDSLKIGLGALIGAGSTLWLTKINNMNQRSSAYIDKRRELILKVVEVIDNFNSATSIYWANLFNAVDNKKNGLKLSPKDAAKLKEEEGQLFDCFTKVTTCRSILHIIGDKKPKERLKEYRDAVDYFFGVGTIKNPNLDHEILTECRKKMEGARTNFFDSLGDSFSKSTGSFGTQ